MQGGFHQKQHTSKLIYLEQIHVLHHVVKKKPTNEAEIPCGQDFHQSLEAHGDQQNPKMIIHFTNIFNII